MSDKPDILAYEKYYSDNSGVEFGIRYDRKPYGGDESIIGFVTLTHAGDIQMPVCQLPWLIEKLQKIAEIAEIA